MNFTPISKLGEFGLISHLTDKIVLKQPSTIKGVGDDAAVIQFECESEQEGNRTPRSLVSLLSTDMFAEGIHFDLTYTPLRHLGYKAVSTNVSDICAMNGTPTQITVSLCVSNQFSVEALDELYKGIRFACEEYNVDLVGGDTISSNSGMVISISILGRVKKNKVTYRNTANVGNILCISGDLGSAYAGLMILERGKKTFSNTPEYKPDLTGYEYVLKRQLMPKARTDIIELFKTHNVIPTAMIDISDGLSSEVHHLCSGQWSVVSGQPTENHPQLRVGCIIDEERIPIHENVKKVAEEFKNSALSFALNGGEDYELLFTVSKSDFEKLSPNPSSGEKSMITRIGEMVEPAQGISLRDKTGKMEPLTAKGWDSFEKM